MGHGLGTVSLQEASNTTAFCKPHILLITRICLGAASWNGGIYFQLYPGRRSHLLEVQSVQGGGGGGGMDTRLHAHKSCGSNIDGNYNQG